MMKKPCVYFLVGPTAVGKTAVSISLARRMGAEIVSADSIQIYRGLEIGSAKPSFEEMQGVSHHMLSVAEIGDPAFNVARYREMAERCIGSVLARGNLPLVVGGTGLYIHALTHPLQFTEVPGDEAVRAELMRQEREDPGSLYRQLQAIDPQRAERLHPNDLKRVVRALEVHLLSGKPMSEHGTDFQNKQQGELPYDIRIAGLTMERAALYARIEQRVDAMLRQGLLDEVKTIYKSGYDPALPALQGIGYKQLLRYYGGKHSDNANLADAIAEIKRETRRFAKRQWTWFKRDQRIQWFEMTEQSTPDAVAQLIYDYFHPLNGKGDRNA